MDQKKLQAFVKEHNRILKKYGVTLNFRLEIPYDKPPVLARLAFWLLNRFNASIRTTVVPVKQ